MLFPLCRSTVINPRALTIRRTPQKFLGRGFGPYPKRIFVSGLFWRVFFEHSPPRFIVPLLPFVAAILLFPEAALAFSQAPLFMFGAVLLVETFFLSIADPEKRRALVEKAEVARRLDLLRVRSAGLLTDIAAARGLQAGALSLVVEQSGLARVPTLTLVSLQLDPPAAADAKPMLLDLTDAERRMIETRLFDAGLTERMLHQVNLVEMTFTRVETLDPRAISAHARLAALAAS